MAQIQSTLKRKGRGRQCSSEEAAAIKAAYCSPLFVEACKKADEFAVKLDAQTRRGMHKIIN